MSQPAQFVFIFAARPNSISGSNNILGSATPTPETLAAKSDRISLRTGLIRETHFLGNDNV
jgi:hypothetical protein